MSIYCNVVVVVVVSLACTLASVDSLILVVGATGGTGLRAIRGLLDTGFAPSDICVLTRNKEKPIAKDLASVGFGIVEADLDKPESLKTAIPGACTGCYVHSTAADTMMLDTGEATRAKVLASALEACGSVKTVVFNSAVGEPGHGVYRIQQKHDAEDAYIETFSSTGIKFVALRANLFMEELWKNISGRPKVLNGKFGFALPPERKLYLTSVRDMGRLAGRFLSSEGDNSAPAVRRINVAGDCLTCPEIAAAFAKAQGSPCEHNQARILELFAKIFFRDLYSIIRYYQVGKETTDIAALRNSFPGDITSFADFLEETKWGDKTRSFDDFVNVKESFALETCNTI